MTRGLTTSDVIVVGAGIAGLVTARTLQQAGASVTVLDQSTPGGRARSVEREGFVLNQGAHALHGGGAAAGVLSGLGVTIDGSPPSPDVGVVDCGVVLSAAEAMGEIGPLVDAVQWIAGLALSPQGAMVARLLVRTTTYCNDVDHLSADAAHDGLRHLLTTGVTYLHGGWQRLVDQLLAGVEVHRCDSARLQIDGGAIRVGDHRAGAAVVAASARAVLGAPDRWAGVGEPVTASCLDLGSRTRSRHGVVLDLVAPLYLSTHSVADGLAPDGLHLCQLLGYDGADRQTMERFAATAGIEPGDVVMSRYLRQGNVAVCGDWVGAHGMLADASILSGAAAAAMCLDRVGVRR
jgi:hypothetical protein